MTDTTISVRIDKSLREKMKALDYINWSAILRKAIIRQIEENRQKNREKMRKASESMDKIRASGVFNEGKTGTEIIREWRDKRRF